MTLKSTRRTFLKHSAALGAATLAAPAISYAADREISVGTYGGYFEDSFKKFIYPEFTKATGIKVNSVAVPTGEAWLVQIINTARAGKAPADVSMMAGTPRKEGVEQNVFKALDPSKISNIGNLTDDFVERGADGKVYGVGAVSWFITLCTNTEAYPEAPTSWKALWDPANAGNIGVLSLASNSYLLEVTATTYFGGTEILDTREGIAQVFDKLNEIVPNVRLWYRDEGQFQQALQDGEIPMGQYYHDVTGLAAAEGFPVRSTFPEEGGIVDSGYWVVPDKAEPVAQAPEFIDYICDAGVQASLSRNVGTAPVIAREKTDLTDEEFAAVSSDIAPIIPRYDMYSAHRDWISDRWNEMIAG